jgi:hypothetical protein
MHGPGVVTNNREKNATMSAEIVGNAGGIVTMRVSGTLLEPELASAQKTLANIIRQQGKVRVLVLVEGFEGWGRGEWNDIEFQERNDPSVEKMAIVGDKKWKDLALLFTAKGLRPFPIEYFAPGEQAKAQAWLAAST